MGQNRALEMDLPAACSSVPRARAAAAAFARQAGMAPERVEELRLVVSEAVTNVVLHAYDGAAGSVRVTVATAGADLWVLVEDDGLGLRAGGTSPGLGLGLSLIETLSDELAVEQGAGGGTLLRIRFGLGVPQANHARARRPSGRRRLEAGAASAHALPAQARVWVSSAIWPASPNFSTTK